MERHTLFVSLAPRVEHPQSVEPPPENVQRCYTHNEDNHDSGARADTGKGPATTDQSKKRTGSSPTGESPEGLTRKRRRIIIDWSEEEVAEEDARADMLNPRRKRSEHTMQEETTPAAKGSQEGQTPPVGLTPSARTSEEENRPPPQDGGQGSSTQHQNQGQPWRHAFTTIHRSSDL
jgi:hypothetical protein